MKDPMIPHCRSCDSSCHCIFTATALQGRASQSARQTATALLQYCSTGDARVLLAVQRHLCGIQDANGDTSVLVFIHGHLQAESVKLEHDVFFPQSFAPGHHPSADSSDPAAGPDSAEQPATERPEHRQPPAAGTSGSTLTTTELTSCDGPLTQLSDSTGS